jgi:hypothetical protein
MSTDDPPADRRETLFAKREQLRATQAERMAQRRQADIEARFARYLGAALAAAGVRHELLWQRDTRRGPLASYPIGFASVRWDRVPHAVTGEGGHGEGQAALFGAALLALGIAPSTSVIVDWGVDGQPRVVLSAADASTHALALMRNGADMWVYADDAPWLIEIYHEGSVTYASGPGQPEDAGDGWRQRSGP